MPEDKRPAWAWVQEARRSRESALSALHQAMLEDEDYLNWASVSRGAAQVYLSGLPDGYTPNYPPHAQAALQTGVNRMVSGALPDVRVTFPAGSFNHYRKEDREGKEREARDLMVRWVRADARHVLAKQVENVAREMAGKTVGLGQSAVFYPIDFSAWVDPPFGWLPLDEKTGEKKPAPPRVDNAENRDKLRQWERARRRSYPWATRALHPTWVFWDLGHDPPRDYIIVEMVSPSSVAERFPGRWALSEELTLERVTYVSDKWAGQWVDGVPVLKGKGVVDGVAANQSGQPWVQMSFSGMGNLDAEGRWLHRIKGNIRDGRDTLLLMAKAWNWMACLSEMGAFPLMQGPRRQLEQLEFGANAPGIEVEGQERGLSVLEPPKTPEQVFRLWEIATALFALQFGAEVLRGEFKSEPMGSLRTRADLAGMPFEAPKVSLEQAWAAMVEHKLEMIKYVLHEGVTVEGVTMRPSDVVEGVQIEIDMTPLTEADKATQREVGQADVALKAMTVEEFIRIHRGIDDAGAVMTAVAVEDMRTALLADPDAMMKIKEYYLAELEKELGPSPAAAAPEEEAAIDPASTEQLEVEQAIPMSGPPPVMV